MLNRSDLCPFQFCFVWVCFSSFSLLILSFCCYKQTLTLVRGKIKKNHNTLFEYSWLKDMQTLKVLIARSVKPLSVKL